MCSRIASGRCGCSDLPRLLLQLVCLRARVLRLRQHYNCRLGLGRTGRRRRARQRRQRQPQEHRAAPAHQPGARRVDGALVGGAAAVLTRAMSGASITRGQSSVPPTSPLGLTRMVRIRGCRHEGHSPTSYGIVK